MSLDLTAARAAITSLFQARTLRVIRDEGDTVLTEACGFSPRGGRLEEGGAAIQMRGEYVLTLPADTDLELIPDEDVTIDEIPGRTFRVIYAPPPSNLRLSRQYGISENR